MTCKISRRQNFKRRYTAGDFNNALFNNLFRSCVNDTGKITFLIFSILVLLIVNNLFRSCVNDREKVTF